MFQIIQNYIKNETGIPSLNFKQGKNSNININKLLITDNITRMIYIHTYIHTHTYISEGSVKQFRVNRKLIGILLTGRL